MKLPPRGNVKTRIYEAGAGVKDWFGAEGCERVRGGCAARVLASLLVRTVWHCDRCLWRFRFAINGRKIFRVVIIHLFGPGST